MCLLQSHQDVGWKDTGKKEKNEGTLLRERRWTRSKARRITTTFIQYDQIDIRSDHGPEGGGGGLGEERKVVVVGRIDNLD